MPPILSHSPWVRMSSREHPTMHLEIRTAEPADFEAIEYIEEQADRLFVETFHATHWPPANSAAERLEQGGFILVGTSAENALIGFAHVIEAEGIAHLEQVSVLPAQGRRGYGRALVEAAMCAARVRGYTDLTLRTYADLPWNGPFYRKLGFTESEPDGRFLRGLVEAERAEGLEQYGSRVQMTVSLA